MRKSLVFFFFLLVLSVPQHAFAESSEKSIEAEVNLISFEYPEDKKPPEEEYLVRVTVLDSRRFYYPAVMPGPGIPYPSRPVCKNCPIKIKLDNPQESDSITQSSENTDQKGKMSAKVISRVFGKRFFYAEAIMPDGSQYISRKHVLNYYDKEDIPSLPPSAVAQPPTQTSSAPKSEIRPSSPNVTAGQPQGLSLEITEASSQKPERESCPMRELFLKWDPVKAENVTYTVYIGRDPNSKVGEGVGDTSSQPVGALTNTKVLVSAEYDWYIKVEGCTRYTCISSPWEFLLGRCHKGLVTQLQNSSIPIEKLPTMEEKSLTEVETHKRQPERPKLKQGVEKIVSDILGWITARFPFLR